MDLDTFIRKLDSYQKKYNLTSVGFQEVIYRLSNGNGELFSKWSQQDKNQLITQLENESLVKQKIKDIGRQLAKPEETPGYTHKTVFLFLSSSPYSKQEVVKMTSVDGRTYFH